MKKLALILLFTFSSLYSMAATTIVGPVMSSGSVVSNGKLIISLKGCASPTVSGGGIPQLVYTLTLDSSANIPITSLVGNDLIYCNSVSGTTYYDFQTYSNSNILLWEKYYKVFGTLWNLNTASPLTNISSNGTGGSVQTNPTATQVVSQPSGTSLVINTASIDHLTLTTGPASSTDAATKGYVDSIVGNSGGVAAAGNTGAVQYNTGNHLAADSFLMYNSSTHTLTSNSLSSASSSITGIGTGCLQILGSGAITTTGGSCAPGTVISIGLSLPGSLFNISGSPVSSTGTLTGTLVNQSGNLVFASPNGTTGTPGFRELLAADIPALAYLSSSTVLSATKSSITSQWFNSYNASTGLYTSTQPAFSDISGNIACSQLPSLIGSVNSSTGSCSTTLSTVNSNTGGFGSSTQIPSFTVGGDGRLTAASTNAVVAPAGTLTGTTLASNVVSSSITTLGTITTGVWNGNPIAPAYLLSTISPSSIGSSTQIPVLTYNGSGQITSVSTAIPTVNLINSVSYPSSPTINTVPVVTGTNTITYEKVPNSAILNSSVTINGTNIALGGTGSIASTSLTDTSNITYLNSTSNTFTGSISAASLEASNLTPGNCLQAAAGGAIVTISGACGSSSGTITATGSPVSGNLTKFSGATSITNADLSGDVVTSGTLATTVNKINGVSLASLSTGLIKNTTITGVPSIATAGIDYQAAGNYITNLTGDAVASGPGSVSLTLATVNTNTGSFGSSSSIPNFTVNGKGLITAASSNVVIAPASTLTGTTLASNIVSSSLTSVGIIGTGTWHGSTIDNTYITNDSTSVNGQSCILGSSCTILASPNGSASGDLSGTYPNPTVIAINGVTLSGLSTGLLKNTTTTGIPSIATAGTDYQVPGSYITALTGDISASGPGSSSAILSTVNSNVGSCGDSTHVCQVTLDGKGRATAATPITITTYGTINSSAQFNVPYYSVTGANNTLDGNSSFTYDGSGNVKIGSSLLVGNTNLTASGAATSSTVYQNSNILTLKGSYWNGSSAADDIWTMHTNYLDSIASPGYPVTELLFTHSTFGILSANTSWHFEGDVAISNTLRTPFLDTRHGSAGTPDLLAHSNLCSSCTSTTMLPQIFVSPSTSGGTAPTTTTTWNTGGTLYGGNTPSSYSGMLIDIRPNGSSTPTFSVDSSGNLITSGTITGTTINATGFQVGGSPLNFSNLSGNVGTIQMPALTGDITTSAGTVATTLATVNSNTGSCGDSTHSCQVTLDAKGRATAATSVAIGFGGTIVLGGQLITSGTSSAQTTTISGLTTSSICVLFPADAPAATQIWSNVALSQFPYITVTTNTATINFGATISSTPQTYNIVCKP